MAKQTKASEEQGKVGKTMTSVKAVKMSTKAVPKTKAIKAKAKVKKSKPRVKTTKDDKKPTRNDWETNNENIMVELMKFYRTHERRPTNAELARATKLTTTTIKRHFDKIDPVQIFADEKKKLAAQAPELFFYIMQSARAGKSRSQELAVQIAFDWAKPTKMIIDDPNAVGDLPESLEEVETIIANLNRYADDIRRLASTTSS